MSRNRSKPPANNRVKWGLVTLLALALLYVVTRPTDNEQPATAAAKPAATPRKRHDGVSGKHTPKLTRPLRPAPLETVLSYNPFEYDGKCVVPRKPVTGQSVEPAVQPVVVARRPKAAPDPGKVLRQSLAGKEADIILESSSGRSARIGDRIVREGKRFDRGVVVRRIQPDNVILQVQPRPNPR
jgi:hypothetical protein